MIFDIFKDAVEYTKGNNSTILKLGLCYFFSIFIIPFLLIEGYSYKLIKYSLKGTINVKEELPKFKGIIILTINGLKFLIIKFIYLLPGFLLFLIGLYLGWDTKEIIIPICALLFVGYFLSIIAKVHMINNNERLLSAFDIKSIIKIIKSVGVNTYIKFYLYLTSVIIGVASLSLFFISIISWLIILFINIIFFSKYYLYIDSLVILIFVLSTLFGIFILLPIYTILESRATSSIYNLR